MDTIVGGTGFCTEDGDLELAGIGPFDQLFDEAVPHHAVTYDGQSDFAHDCLWIGVIKHHSGVRLPSWRGRAIDANQVSLYISPKGWFGEIESYL
ncbi:hypothetical protein D3C85_1780020 [compost metagenome]